MTERDLYDAALIEINKLEAPSMLLEDYNYFINKAIQQYINKVYNRYEINQQATDDLRVLKVPTSLILNEFKNTGIPNENSYYFAVLPKDYLHILNCVVKFNKIGEDLPTKCNNSYDLNNAFVARKLTSDIYPSIINNAYFKPSYKTPYYTITSIDESSVFIENILNPDNVIVSDKEDILSNILDPAKTSEWKGGFVINIRCGKTNKFKPTTIYIDYIKTPRVIKLTEEMLEGEDTTKEMEFPEYVCYEIINEFVKLLLENASDPRLQTNIPINQTIIPPSSN